MKPKFVLILALGILSSLLILYSFQRKPVTCSEIQENEIRTMLASGPINLEKAKEWLHNSEFDGVEVGGINDGNGQRSAGWTKDSIGYNIKFRNDIAVNVGVYWKLGRRVALEPTGAEILTCFGPPDWYRAVYLMNPDGRHVELSLWYLEKGIIVGSSPIYFKSQPPTFSDQVIMSGMSLLPPHSTAQKMIENTGYPIDIREEVLKSLQPWPGAWQKIVVSQLP
jgi:hypothetical protein